MTSADPYITAFYRRSTGRPFDSAYADFVAAFRADPALVQTARTELEALKQTGAMRNGFQGDHEGNIRARALTRMLSQFDSGKG